RAEAIALADAASFPIGFYFPLGKQHALGECQFQAESRELDVERRREIAGNAKGTLTIFVGEERNRFSEASLRSVDLFGAGEPGFSGENDIEVAGFFDAGKFES